MHASAAVRALCGSRRRPPLSIAAASRTVGDMPFWLTIEVQDAETPASGWRRAYGESLLEAALTNGARNWEWHTPRWGLILELIFSDERARNAFRELPAVIAALDAVPIRSSGCLCIPAAVGGQELASHAGLGLRPSPEPPKPTNRGTSFSTWRATRTGST